MASIRFTDWIVAILASPVALSSAAARSNPVINNRLNQGSFADNPNQLLGGGDLITAFRRGVIDKGTLYSELKKQGLSEDNVDRLLITTRFIPSAPDVANWAAREAFQEEYIQRFGGDQEYPEEMSTLAGMVGADYDPFGNQDSVMRYFWRAHWIIPSLQMGFDMAHRGIISQEELDSLFVAADVMPGWREKLQKLSYSLPTRVDVRRMFRIGVLNREQVLDFYIRLGYSPEDAESMTVFTEITEGEEYTKLTRTQIVNSYSTGLIDDTECRELLGLIGTPDNDIDYWISKTDLDREESITRRKVEFLTEQRLHGIIDEVKFIGDLNALGMETAEIELLLAEVQDKIERNIAVPPRTTVMNWYKLGLIDADSLRSKLVTLGYKAEDLELFVQEAVTKPVGEPRMPTKADLLSWFKKGMLQEDEVRARLSELGYPEWAIDNYVSVSRT